MSERRIAFISDAASEAAKPAREALERAGFEIHSIDPARADAAGRLVRETLRPKRSPGESGAEAASSLEEALAPVAERMRKLSLRPAFVAGLLKSGASLELGTVAMQWAGMPNKNERALTFEVLEALADAGFLARESPDRYKVTRSAE